MKKDKFLVACVIDRSGSMSTMWDECVNGLTTFIEEQKQHKGETVFDLVVFDNYYDVVFENANIQDVAGFDGKKYPPRGMTALYDAIGKTIANIGSRLSALDEQERPEKVIICILTDGHENCSQGYTADILKKQITTQQNDYNWSFVFLGANQDSILSSGEIGIKAAYASNYSATKSGMTDAYTTMSASVRSIKGI